MPAAATAAAAAARAAARAAASSSSICSSSSSSRIFGFRGVVSGGSYFLNKGVSPLQQQLQQQQQQLQQQLQQQQQQRAFSTAAAFDSLSAIIQKEIAHEKSQYEEDKQIAEFLNKNSWKLQEKDNDVLVTLTKEVDGKP